MTRAIAVLGALAVLALSAVGAHAQGGPPPAAELVVVVRVEAIEAVPDCGDAWVAPVARHRVLRVERGSYAPATLYAFHDCGQVSAHWRVTPGAVFRLWLSRRAPAQMGSPIDSMGDPAMPRWFVVRGEPATP